MEFEGTEFPEPEDYDLLPIDVFNAIRRPAWQHEAKCRDVPGDRPGPELTRAGKPIPGQRNLSLMFPEPKDSRSKKAPVGNHRTLAKARSICKECPVRYECLEYGLLEKDGTWGGHSPSQRRRITDMMKMGISLVDASKVIDARSRDAR